MSYTINGQDLGRALSIFQSIAPASITATTTGSEVNCTGAQMAMVEISAGVISAADSSNYCTFSITECATTGGSFTAMAAGQQLGINGWDKVINATTEGSAIYRMNVVLSPGYPYIKVVGTETGTFSGIYGANVVFIGYKQPSAQVTS